MTIGAGASVDADARRAQGRDDSAGPAELATRQSCTRCWPRSSCQLLLHRCPDVPLHGQQELSQFHAYTTTTAAGRVLRPGIGAGAAGHRQAQAARHAGCTASCASARRRVLQLAYLIGCCRRRLRRHEASGTDPWVHGAFTRFAGYQPAFAVAEALGLFVLPRTAPRGWLTCSAHGRAPANQFRLLPRRWPTRCRAGETQRRRWLKIGAAILRNTRCTVIWPAIRCDDATRRRGGPADTSTRPAPGGETAPAGTLSATSKRGRRPRIRLPNANRSARQGHPVRISETSGQARSSKPT